MDSATARLLFPGKALANSSAMLFFKVALALDVPRYHDVAPWLVDFAEGKRRSLAQASLAGNAASKVFTDRNQLFFDTVQPMGHSCMFFYIHSRVVVFWEEIVSVT